MSIIIITCNQEPTSTDHTSHSLYLIPWAENSYVLRITTLKPDSIYNTHNILKYFSQLQISKFMLILRNSYYWLGVAMFLLPVVSGNVGQFLLFVTLVIWWLVLNCYYSRIVTVWFVLRQHSRADRTLKCKKHLTNKVYIYLAAP